MKTLILATTLLFLSVTHMFAQAPVTILRATSATIKILDGDDLQAGGLAPELRPDVYVYHKSGKPKRIVYYTNIDSISFNVNPGDTYNFAVLLNNKDTCYQRITGDNPNKVAYTKPSKSKAFTNDTIPFLLGANNAIHIKGKLNNSDTLDLIFDTGASMGVLSDEGSEKKAVLDKANKNKFEFAGITIGNSPAIFVNYHGSLKADGVIGYNVFEDKIVEINYDKSMLVVHTSIEDAGKTYAVNEMIWRGSNMYIACVSNINNKKCKGNFLFDTGSKWALSLTKGFAATNELYGSMPKVGTRRASGVSGKPIKCNTVTLPQLVIGNFALSNVPIDLELPSATEGLDKNILGNDVLKRFNAVLDYKNGLIYLQPNSLTGSAYNKSFDENLLFIGAAILAGLLIAGLLVIKIRKRSRHHQARTM